jgi:hypothetical protein
LRGVNDGSRHQLGPSCRKRLKDSDPR